MIDYRTVTKMAEACANNVYRLELDIEEWGDPKFDDICNKLHDIYLQLKTISDEIKEK